jgi:hypothetical protein
VATLKAPSGGNAGVLPSGIAAGPKNPRDRDQCMAWRKAGNAWSAANLGNSGGWVKLLSTEVRQATGARARLTVIDPPIRR